MTNDVFFMLGVLCIVLSVPMTVTYWRGNMQAVHYYACLVGVWALILALPMGLGLMGTG